MILVALRQADKLTTVLGASLTFPDLLTQVGAWLADTEQTERTKAGA
ncbi:hypothetical protein OH768_47095 [Streptomyces sp. NBC_01622]|nr:hypothetical protein OH768_47095 [Streptomyces sp. NBC_01622]